MFSLHLEKERKEKKSVHNIPVVPNPWAVGIVKLDREAL